MKKILDLSGITGLQEAVAGIAPGWEVVASKDKADALPHLAEAEIVMGWNSDAATECVKPGAALRWVQSWRAGIDYMPLAALAKKGVYITTASGVNHAAVSETALGLMLGLTRQFHLCIRNQDLSRWDTRAVSSGVGEMHYKTVGILGAGTIGEEIAKICKAFEMKVLGLSRSGKPRAHFDEMYTDRQLLEMLPLCDYVVSVLPLTDATHHMMSTRQFGAMKTSAFFVNVGRGPTADTAALTKALQDGQIAGAGLDVVEPEPLESSSPLWGMDNVIVLPHIGGFGPYYNQRVLDIFVDNFKDYLAGRAPGRNLVDYTQGY